MDMSEIIKIEIPEIVEVIQIFDQSALRTLDSA